MTTRETVFSQIKKSGHVPILPEILLRLLEACDNESTPLTKVASLIDKDPSLSYKVLQLVNSAYFGLRTTYSGIDQAVVYLGANSVKNMAVTAAVHQVFDVERFDSLKHFDIHSFWYHCLKCATLSRRIAEQTGLANPDDAYLAGLLHDLGRLVLVSVFTEQYESILAGISEETDLLSEEKDLIGATHAEVGDWLVRDWNLSSLIADTIGYHHEHLENIKQALPLVKIIYLANLLSKPGDTSPLFKTTEALLGISADDLQEICEGTREEILQISSELGIHIQITAGPGEKGQTERVVSDAAAVQTALASRIKGITLLSGFLENVAQADDSDKMLQAFEQSMQVLLGIDQVILLLPDRDNVLLIGRTSESSKLYSLSREFVLPVQKNSSRVVAAYLSKTVDYLSLKHEPENLADRQVLSAFNCPEVALIPLVAEQKEVGVILLGLPIPSKKMSKDDYRLIRTIAQQVAVGLHLENIKSKKAEEIELERKAAISMTARKFAHEVNNPLGIINNYLTSLKLKVSDKEGIQEELTIISEEIQRISSMINQLDIFTRTSFAPAELVDINVVIADIVRLVKSSFFTGSEVVLAFEPDSSLPQIKTSSDGVKQILINLIKNGYEAMADGGTVTIRTGPELGPQQDQDPRILITVSDDGPGLPDEVREKLYKPFVTTKGIGHSGLGLSIVHKGVEDLGGRISCFSGQEGGTRFEISLPRA